MTKKRTDLFCSKLRNPHEKIQLDLRRREKGGVTTHQAFFGP
jgi:hypothetical protein